MRFEEDGLSIEFKTLVAFDGHLHVMENLSDSELGLVYIYNRDNNNNARIIRDEVTRRRESTQSTGDSGV